MACAAQASKLAHSLSSHARIDDFIKRLYGYVETFCSRGRCCQRRLVTSEKSLFVNSWPYQHLQSRYGIPASYLAAPTSLLPTPGSIRCLYSCATASPPQQCRQYSSAAVGEGTNGSMHTDSVECVVIGAGVIGLAIARALALRGHEVVVVEAAGAVGTEISSRHSEVIHAGIYYPHGSLKARMCVEGKARLYEFCRTHNVPHKNITKLIVATSKEQLPDLVAFQAAAARNGVTDLQLLKGAEARRLEPALDCQGALLSPSTGILDSHTYMAALLADAESHGAVLALNTRVVGGWLDQTPLTTTPTRASAAPVPVPMPYKILELHSLPSAGAEGGSGGGWGPVSGSSSRGSPGSSNSSSSPQVPEVAATAAERVTIEISQLRAHWVVNAAGLQAMRVAASIAGLPRSSIPRLYLAKGNYYSLSVRSPFNRLIYPMPERGLAGLGTHLTLDMAGGARFGPDVEWLPGPGIEPGSPVVVDYRVDPARAESFYPAIRRYYPALPNGALQPAYSGVRPKLSGPGEPPVDFLVQGAREGHGVRGWVNLYGIESPGLTSSLALAEYLCDMLENS